MQGPGGPPMSSMGYQPHQMPPNVSLFVFAILFILFLFMNKY